MVATDFENIEKEMIENLKFPSSEVLNDPAKITQRTADLERALSLGNLEHSKIKIYFEDENSCKLVETTVWAVTDKRVILKQGVGIPINRIHSLSV
ncbi:hypothetical protein CNR22_22035 [Sphingobacteriaceae bacterium]|nr:hypothetical protein CNR22_22035 [Sphingobacteriaceae bacterium]